MDDVISYYWNNIITPSTVKVTQIDGENNARVTVEPLQSGFGVTLGNAMRRVLLSSLCGAAVESIEIDGAVSEYSVLSGVNNDIGDIILNIKRLVLRADNTQDCILYLRVDEPGPVMASMIICEDGIEVVNKDLYICTLEKGSTLNMKLYVKFGIGYSQAKRSRAGGSISTIGRISIDALHNPVKFVNSSVESIRIGGITDYDKLLLDVETNGAINVEQAVVLAAKILQKQFAPCINLDDSNLIDSVQGGGSDELPQYDCDPIFLCKVDTLDLSVRAQNCLKGRNIVYVGDLVQQTEQEILKTANFGRKSLRDIKGALGNMGLDFGQKIDNWSQIVEAHKNKESEKKD